MPPLMSSTARVQCDSPFRRATWMVRLLGPLGAASAMWTSVARRIAKRPIDDAFFDRRDGAFDRRFDVKTSGHVPVAEMRVSHADRSEMVEYRPMPPHDVAAGLAALPIDRRAYHLIDLGCGMGRVLVIGGVLRFASVTGVELAPELAEIAEGNIEQVRKRLPTTEFDVRRGSASTFEVPNDPLVVFLFNPFGEGVLRAVLERLESSLEAAPRDCWIVYANALHASSVEDRKCWRLVSQRGGWWQVFRFAGGAEAPADVEESDEVVV